MAEDDSKETLDQDLREELAACGSHDAAAIIQEFDLLAISDDVQVLSRAIAGKIKDRVQTYMHLFEDLLQPDNGLSSLNECSFFTEEQHKRIVKGYRKLMVTLRQYTEADLISTKESYRAFIADALTAWANEKAHLLQVTKQIQEGWKSEELLQRDKGYFG